jgi:1-acyl-sn-glycerol-3-phosphate acyltransferase
MLRVWGRITCWLSGIEVIIEGEEHLRTDAPCVILMNHTSIIDMFLISMNMPPRLVVVGKKELLYVPFIGQLFWLMRFITVDRKNRERALASMSRANAIISEHKLRVLVAPEGTRTRTGDLGPFKKGAFYTAMDIGCPIVSMVLAGSYALHPGGQLSTTPGRVRIRVLPPVDSSDFTPENLADKAQWFRGQMQEALDDMYRSDPKLLRMPPGDEDPEQASAKERRP